MRELLICLLLGCSLLLAGCGGDAEAQDPNLPLASVLVAATVDETAPEPMPNPAPTPGGVCDNCNGSGKVGDGTVFVTCMKCEGDGRLGATAAVDKMRGCQCIDCTCADEAEAELAASEIKLELAQEQLREWEAFRVKYAAWHRTQHTLSQTPTQTMAPPMQQQNCPGGVCTPQMQPQGRRSFWPRR